MMHVTTAGVEAALTGQWAFQSEKKESVGRPRNEVLKSGMIWCIVGHMKRMLLSGEFDHTLDPKGRVTLPARYREYFEDGAVLVRFLDREPCICVFRSESWEEFDAKHVEPLDVFESGADDWRTRMTYKNQDPVEPDRQGRVLLPAHRIKELGLSGKVKIIGNRTHLEIWDPDTLAAREKEMWGSHA
jgi:MraZ protein